MLKKRWLPFLLLLFAGGLTACRRSAPVRPDSVTLIAESPVQEIPMNGPAADSRAEISGMAWCGENLILLPQYPMIYKDENQAGYVFSIPKSALQEYLTGEGDQTLLPEMKPFDTKGIERSILGFEGFESLTFYQDQVFLTIESRQGDQMVGYLVRGSILGNCDGLTLRSEEPLALAPQADLGNMSDETLVIYEDRLYTIYEANGVNVNPDPAAHRFDLSLDPEGALPLPNIEYRVTDATQADPQGEFWAINYFFPGDTKLEPGADQIAIRHGLGESHQGQHQVERLVALKIAGDAINMVDRPPIYLTLSGAVSRNWEGIVRYGEGFLLVTDEHPTTILAYVKNIHQD